MMDEPSAETALSTSSMVDERKKKNCIRLSFGGWENNRQLPSEIVGGRVRGWGRRGEG